MHNAITVLTGKFRKVHEGHLFLLKQAYCLGYPVIVLLNSDNGVLSLGSKSLGSTFENRKREVLQTGFVDKVLWFYKNPTAWLRILKPTYIIAGSDHTKEEILSKGGIYSKEIIIIDRIKGFSATKILGE